MKNWSLGQRKRAAKGPGLAGRGGGPFPLVWWPRKEHESDTMWTAQFVRVKFPVLVFLTVPSILCRGGFLLGAL